MYLHEGERHIVAGVARLDDGIVINIQSYEQWNKNRRGVG
jgi:hypothetical protein